MAFRAPRQYQILIPQIAKGIEGITAHFAGVKDPWRDNKFLAEYLFNSPGLDVVRICSSAAHEAYAQVYKDSHAALYLFDEHEETVFVHAKNSGWAAWINFSTAEWETMKPCPDFGFLFIGGQAATQRLGQFIEEHQGLAEVLVGPFIRNYNVAEKNTANKSICGRLSQLSEHVSLFARAIKERGAISSEAGRPTVLPANQAANVVIAKFGR